VVIIDAKGRVVYTGFGGKQDFRANGLLIFVAHRRFVRPATLAVRRRVALVMMAASAAPGGLVGSRRHP